MDWVTSIMMEGVTRRKARREARRRTRTMLVLSCLVVCLAGCQWETPSRPSVLVFVVESLGFSLVPCQSVEFETNPSGLRTLCEESVRFTHAFTPSVMSQA